MPATTHNRDRGRTTDTERVTVRLPDDLEADYEDLVDAGVYPNLSEALRAGLRAGHDEIDSGGER